MHSFRPPALALVSAVIGACQQAPEPSQAPLPPPMDVASDTREAPQQSQWWLMRGSLTVELANGSADASLTLGNLHVDADGAIQGEAQLVLGSWRSEQTPELAHVMSTQVWDAQRDVYLPLHLASQSADTVTVTWQGPSGPVSARMPYTLTQGELMLGPAAIATRSVLTESQRTALEPWLDGPTLRVSGAVRITNDLERAEASSRTHWQAERGAARPVVAVTSAHLEPARRTPTYRDQQRDPAVAHPQDAIGEVSRDAIVLDP